jgi:hypothetical protein
MAAILKLKMAAARGRFLSGTRPEMNQYESVPLCQIWCFYTDLHDFSLIGWTTRVSQCPPWRYHLSKSAYNVAVHGIAKFIHFIEIQSGRD